MSDLSQIRVVLVETSHPGNIGSSARAMKTMGLSELSLVRPRKFPHPEAVALASGAIDVLEQATVFDSLEEALSDCHLVIGSSARERNLQIPFLSPDNFANKIFEPSFSGNTALVFGREHAGLTNEELYQCHYHINIPTNPKYSSLNLAQAVQVLSYELRVFWLKENQNTQVVSGHQQRVAAVGEVEGFYRHLEETLIDIDFMDRTQPKKLMAKIRRLFNRAHLNQDEINILRGILTAVNKQIGDTTDHP